MRVLLTVSSWAVLATTGVGRSWRLTGPLGGQDFEHRTQVLGGHRYNYHNSQPITCLGRYPLQIKTKELWLPAPCVPVECLAKQIARWVAAQNSTSMCGTPGPKYPEIEELYEIFHCLHRIPPQKKHSRKKYRMNSWDSWGIRCTWFCSSCNHEMRRCMALSYKKEWSRTLFFFSGTMATSKAGERATCSECQLPPDRPEVVDGKDEDFLSSHSLTNHFAWYAVWAQTEGGWSAPFRAVNKNPATYSSYSRSVDKSTRSSLTPTTDKTNTQDMQ